VPYPILPAPWAAPLVSLGHFSPDSHTLTCSPSLPRLVISATLFSTALPYTMGQYSAYSPTAPPQFLGYTLPLFKGWCSPLSSPTLLRPILSELSYSHLLPISLKADALPCSP